MKDSQRKAMWAKKNGKTVGVKSGLPSDKPHTDLSYKNNKIVVIKAGLPTEEPKKEKEPEVSEKLQKQFREDLGQNDDVYALSYNPKWKLTHLLGDNDSEFYYFPNEESAIAFGRQSIKDTASEYIPDNDNAEWKKLSDDEIVEKVLEEQGNYGLSSDLGAIAKSVASYDGEYTELSDGGIVFQIS